MKGRLISFCQSQQSFSTLLDRLPDIVDRRITLKPLFHRLGEESQISALRRDQMDQCIADTPLRGGSRFGIHLLIAQRRTGFDDLLVCPIVVLEQLYEEWVGHFLAP